MSASDISAGYCSWAYDFQVDVAASKFSRSFPFCGRFPKCPRALKITTCAKAPAASDYTEYSSSLLRFCKVPATDAGFDVAAARFYTTGQLHEQEFQKTCTRETKERRVRHRQRLSVLCLACLAICSPSPLGARTLFLRCASPMPRMRAGRCYPWAPMILT